MLTERGRGELAGGARPAARLGWRAAGLGVPFLVALALACAPPTDRHTASREQLYVANAHDGTVSLVSSPVGPRLGAPSGAAGPAAPLAWQIAAGRGGKRLLTLGGGSTHGGEVTLTGRDGGGWWTRSLDLEQDAAATLLTGDGERYGLVAYGEGTVHTRAPASACTLALVDLTDGAVVGRARACAAGETISALQLRTTTGSRAGATTLDDGTPEGRAGVQAVVGVWSPRTGGRVVTVDPVAGTTLLTVPVPGVPTAILLGDDLVHVWVGEPPAEPWQGLADVDFVGPGSVLTLEEPSLHAAALVRLAEAVTAPAIGPSGDQNRGGRIAYGLADARRSLVSVDLATGAVRRLAQLPAVGSSVAVADGKVFVAISERNSLAVYDLVWSVSLRPVPTGRGPLALALTRA